MVTRGDIWIVTLDPTIGSEKPRPCVVVSPSEMHGYLRTVIVALMTTKSRPAPFRVPLKVRLAKKVGIVSGKTLTLTLDTLQEVFAK